MGPFEREVNRFFSLQSTGLAETALPLDKIDPQRLADVVIKVAGQNGVIPEPNEDATSLLNRTITAFRKHRHTPEDWKSMGGFLAQARKLGLNWDKSLLPAPTKKAMGLTEMEEVLPVSANEFHAITDGKTMGRFWQEANGSWAVQYGNETAAYSERGAAQEHAFGRPPMQQSGPVVGAGFGFAEALGEAAEASWSAVARDGMIHAMKKDEEVAFAVLGSDGKPGQVQFLKNPDEADKEKARQAIMNWQDFQRPNQNGTVDAVDGIDEAVTALLG